MIEEIIELGRALKNVSSKKGALINTTDSLTMLTNERYSIAIVLQGSIGSGFFYSEEIPKGTQEIQLRDDKVMFTIETKESKHRIFVPAKANVIDKIIDSIKKNAFDENNFFTFPQKAFYLLDNEILTVTLKVFSGNLIMKQKRPDGTVEKEDSFKLNGTVNDTDEITIFSGDLQILDQIKQLEILINGTEKPLLFKGTFTGKIATGLISHMIYEK